MSSLRDNPQDSQNRLKGLIEHAAAKDAVKDFAAAAELYSQATELQAEINGEMSLENAELLFLYGKSLYNVGVSKSDVLGSKVPSGRPGESDTTDKNSSSITTSSTGTALVKTAVSEPAQKDGFNDKPSEASSSNQPYFQFTGDENFDDSDAESEGDEENPEEEEEDDFANAYEVLDLARILFLRKMEEKESSNGAGKSTAVPQETIHLQERLADTYDLQAEISLEGERFADAVADLKAALQLKEALFPRGDPSVAECHYKLSLALELSSNSHAEGNSEGETGNNLGTIDQAMREEAAKHMEEAIESCKIRIAQEEQKLTGEDMNEDKMTAIQRKIANVKEIVADMEQRLIELQRPPVSLDRELARENAGLNALQGILGEVMGKSTHEKKAYLDEVAKGAKDLSSLVRKKGSTDGPSRKRSASLPDEEETIKRAKTEDAE